MSGAAAAVIPLDEAQARNLLEIAARSAYDVYCGNVRGSPPAWEHMYECEREGWRQVVAYLAGDPECKCGQPLLCVDCDRATIVDAIEDSDEPEVLKGLMCCRVCGCTDDKPCAGGCSWAGEDLCTACVDKVPVVYSESEMNAYIDALRAVAP